MSDFLAQVLQSAPQLGLGLLFVAAVAVLLKEYRSLRTEIRSSVDDAVNAKLGSILGSLQLEAATATKLLGEIGAQDERMRKLSQEFEGRLQERTLSLEASWNHIRSRIAELELQVPEASAVTSQDLTAIAANAPFGEALAMLTKILEDPDATVQDLEVAGDIARKRRRFALAQRLYKRAVDLDPHNVGARLEYLCLSADLKHDGRTEALSEAMELAVRAKKASYEGRVVNTLIGLGRYEELQQLCERILADKPPESSKLYAQALRDLGVAHRNQGRSDAAEDCYQRALAAQPDDENVLSGYIMLLREKKAFARQLEVVRQLLILDPLDGNYYVYMGRALADLKDFDEAIRWYKIAIEMLDEEGKRQTTRREIVRLEKGRELLAGFEAAPRALPPTAV